MLIRGVRDRVDQRYYVPAFIKGPDRPGFRLDLLVDTGAVRTLLTASDALWHGGIIAPDLPAGGTFKGIEGGSVKSYILRATTLRFLTDIGPYDLRWC